MKENSSGSEKNASRFPVDMMEELDKEFQVTQNDSHHHEFHPYVNYVTTKLKRHSQDVFENCFHPIRRISVSKTNVKSGTIQKLK